MQSPKKTWERSHLLAAITVAASDFLRVGAPSARVVIVEFTDYQCPFCLKHAREIRPELHRRFVETGIVRYEMRDFPLPSHPQAMAAAEAARCAAEQGSKQYWRYHEALFDEQAHLADSLYTILAQRVGLSARQFDKCRSSGAARARVVADRAEASVAGFKATPVFVVGWQSEKGQITGNVLTGLRTLEDFGNAVEKARRQVRVQ